MVALGVNVLYINIRISSVDSWYVKNNWMIHQFDTFLSNLTYKYKYEGNTLQTTGVCFDIKHCIYGSGICLFYSMYILPRQSY